LKQGLFAIYSIPDAVYVNSTYLCASKPDFEVNNAHLTFVENGRVYAPKLLS
jgi:hypothetical protein